MYLEFVASHSKEQDVLPQEGRAKIEPTRRKFVHPIAAMWVIPNPFEDIA